MIQLTLSLIGGEGTRLSGMSYRISPVHKSAAYISNGLLAKGNAP
jgi:hypothetical protein